MAELKVSGSGITAEISEFHGNLNGKTASFGIILLDPSKRPLGSLQINVLPEVQAESEVTTEILGFDDYIESSAAAQKVLEGLTELGYELAAKSKMLTVTESDPVSE